jgi:hypothetical protein
MKKIIVLVFLVFGSFNVCVPQSPGTTKSIKIYDTDSASVSKFFKVNIPQAGYKNLYIQLTGYWQGYVLDMRYGDIYRLNYLTNSFQKNYHNNILRSVIQMGTYGWEVGNTIDFAISLQDTNLILCGYVIPFWEPMSKVFYTKNNGDTTYQLNNASMSINFLGAAIDPVNDSIMYYGYPTSLYPYNIYKTTNRGSTWFGTDTINSPAMEGKMYINPMNRNTIFLMNDSYLYRSTSAGYDFQQILNDTIYSSKMVFYVPDNAIYLSCPIRKGILKSTNNGGNWAQIFNKPCNDLEIDPLDANIFYAGTAEGIYKSTNKGVNWFLYNNTFAPSVNVVGIVKNPNTGDTLFAVTKKAAYKVFGQAILDTLTPKYFPLQTGNFYIYHSWNLYDPEGTYYKARITKDTIAFGHKYFYCVNIPGIQTGWVRYDSLTGRLLALYPGNGCDNLINDKIIDSLASGLNDTLNRCPYNATMLRKCSDTSNITLFSGYTTKGKSFNHDGLILSYIKYAMNIGIYSEGSGEPPPISEFSDLRGCYVNGVAYGDTTMPSSLYTVTGNVRYSDNNQPATDGYVKAFKVDANGNIIVMDSALIQTDGSYTLTHVPQDSLDIGVYPNSTTNNDWVITYYPSTIYWETAAIIYPTGNMSDVNVGAIRMNRMATENSISGRVMRLTNNPAGNIKDAVIYVKRRNTFYGCTTTDFNGNFYLASLPQGSVKIIVNRPGFTGDSLSLSLTQASNYDSIYFYLYRFPAGVKKVSSTAPSEYKLYQNYPNPFNPSTNIRYQITNNRFVLLKVYDILGKEIATLVNEKQSPGVYEVIFEGSNLSSGIYFYTLTAGDFKATKRFVLIK